VLTPGRLRVKSSTSRGSVLWLKSPCKRTDWFLASLPNGTIIKSAPMRDESCSNPTSRLLEKMMPESNVAEAIAVKITRPRLRAGWLQKFV